MEVSHNACCIMSLRCFSCSQRTIAQMWKAPHQAAPGHAPSVDCYLHLVFGARTLKTVPSCHINSAPIPQAHFKHRQKSQDLYTVNWSAPIQYLVLGLWVIRRWWMAALLHFIPQSHFKRRHGSPRSPPVHNGSPILQSKSSFVLWLIGGSWYLQFRNTWHWYHTASIAIFKSKITTRWKDN